jgi:hypothetical protein
MGCGVQGAGCRVQGLGCRVWGVGCRVQGAGCGVIIGMGWGFRAPEDEEMDAELAGNHQAPAFRV